MRTIFQPEQNLLEAVKVRSKMTDFFEIKSEILKFSKNDFGSLQQPFKTHKSQNKDFFAGRTIWSAEMNIDFGIFGGSENLKKLFLPLGGSEVIKTMVMNNGWMDLQNEPLAVRICRNPCATIHTLRLGWHRIEKVKMSQQIAQIVMT